MTQARPSIRAFIPDSPDALLDSYARHLVAARKRPETVKSYTISVRLFLKWADANGLPPLTRMRKRDIEAWLASLSDRSSATQHQYALTLRLFFKWLADEDEIPASPIASLALPTVDEPDKDVLSADEMAEALKRMERAKAWRTLAIVALLYDCGIRVGELCSIRIEDTDFGLGVIRLRATEVKGRFPRPVPMSPAVIRHLDRYLRRRKIDSPYLIAGRYGQLSTSTVYDIVRRAFAFTGRKIGPHDLRHTSATHMSEMMGGDELQTIFGWRNPAMARHYTRQAHVANAIAAHRRASPLERLGK